MTLFGLTFGLLFYNFLLWIFPILFLFFVIIPFFMGLFDGDGYAHNVKIVWNLFCKIIELGFKKRNKRNHSTPRT
jgi:predicted ABC-type exoprotein transport system permease subunit